MNDDLEMCVPAGEPFVQNGSSPDTSAGDLAAANAKADENYNKFLLAMADFENYKKRVERQLGVAADGVDLRGGRPRRRRDRQRRR